MVPTDPGSDIVRLGDEKNLHIQTNYGYTRIGPQNTSWSHFITDRARYYFDKGTVNVGLIVTMKICPYKLQEPPE